MAAVASGKGVEGGGAASPNANGAHPDDAAASSPADDRGLPRSNTMPGVIKNAEITNETAGPSNLEWSRTERRRQNNLADDPAKQLMDDNISIRKKCKMLNRIATVKDDGTVVVDVPSTLETPPVDVGTEDGYIDVAIEESLDGADIPYRPPMQIVILIVGTRGDVQPFVAIGKRLQDYGHCVRLATHANFKEFVLTAGLEFYPLGGDPKILAEYMVKNKGFLPSGPSEIPIQRKQIKDIIFSLLPACKDPDPNTCFIMVSPSAFEAHAGEGTRRKPYDNIFTSNRVSLHELSMKISKDMELSERETDELCGECGQGGDIFPCKICPRSFHPACVGLFEVPSEWYCDNCSNLVQKEKALAENKNAKAAGRQAGVDSIEQIMKRAIRIVPISDDLGGCALCNL